MTRLISSLITVEELVRLMDNGPVTILDCTFSLTDTDSGRIQYMHKHIPGAYYMDTNQDLSSPVIKGVTGRHPLPHPKVLGATLRAAGVNAENPVVVYDQHNGMFASRAWWLLRWLGHDQVALLNGGLQAWIAQGLPTDNQWPSPASGQFEEKPDDTLIALRDEIERGVDSLVDSRAYNRYTGETEPIDPIAGHIEGAICIPHLDNTESSGIWKTNDFLSAKFSSLIDSATPVFYCGSGITACHNILAYYVATGHMARLYPGSYSEWINYHQPVTGSS